MRKPLTIYSLMEWISAIGLGVGIGAVVIATTVVLAGFLLWHAPRCTGPLPSDRCAIGGR